MDNEISKVVIKNTSEKEVMIMLKWKSMGIL